jgi:DNA adenine methylase
MKPPISYYGGKQNMLSELLPLIPKHESYIEPFFGGGALFFAKTPSPLEVINDTNQLMINFYRQMVLNFDALELEIGATLHSRFEHKRAGDIIKGRVESTDLEKAWAVYVSTQQGFGKKIDNGWGYCNSSKGCIDRKLALSWANLRDDFHTYKGRLNTVQIECKDALEVIKTYDRKDALFYLDPPYYNSDCGHYKGYKESDYIDLIDLIRTIKGKFILSSYPNPIINELDWVWDTAKDKNRSVNATVGARKTEVIITNFQPPQLQLFK